MQGCKGDTHFLHLLHPSARFAPICQVCTHLPGLQSSTSKCSCVIVECGPVQTPSPGLRRRLGADDFHGARPFYATQLPHPQLSAFRNDVKTAAESFHSINHTHPLLPESAVFGTSRPFLERVGRTWSPIGLLIVFCNPMRSALTVAIRPHTLPRPSTSSLGHGGE